MQLLFWLPFLLGSVSPACFSAIDLLNAVGHYIKERTKNAQFVIISLRNNMFELADRLVGIYKTDNATKTVTINPHQFVVGSAGAAAAAGKARGAAAAAGDAQEQQDQQQQALLQQQQAVPVS
jgi:structural maintenance of chromosome 4